METIDIVIIKEDCQVVDIVEAEMWEESQDDYPSHWDETETVTVLKKDWDADGVIRVDNYKKYII